MGLIIALRVDKNTSYFRRYLRVLISQDEVNHVVLCSGYIEERLPGYSVIRDELWDIIRAKASKSSLELETLGGMFRGKWGGVNRSQYIRFVKSIRIRKTMNRVTNLTYLPYVARKKNWHAKISLFMKDKEPLAAIIGSSNLTRPAYGESGSGPKFATSYKNHNCECDVVIWTPDGPFEQILPDNQALFRVEGDAHAIALNGPFSPIQALFRDTNQAREGERISALYRELIREENRISYDEWRIQKKKRNGR